MNKPDYLAIANQYIADVLRGKIKACKYVKEACKRQRDDLKRKRFEYHFDETKATRICWFIENLTHVKGELAGKRIHLEPWQVFILTTVFGWVDADGFRRFRRSYIEVPRGNGKSSLTSGVALYCLCADGERGAEVYSFATTRDQAKIVFGDAKVMAEGNPALRKAFGVEVLANAVVRKASNSTFQAKSAEGSTLDGLNTHLACVDELHAHKTRAVYDVVETSLGKRRQSLMWVITTAGFDLSGICYEVRSMVTAVLSKSVIDEHQFGIIYTIDEGDDWKTVEALEKANPNWGISVRPEVIQGLHEKAKFQSSARNNFLTKHLNVWCNASSAWMNMEAWDACGDSSLSVDDFEDSECCTGLDLASKRDIAAKVMIFRKRIDDKDHFFAFPTFYLPESAIQESTNSQYEGWVDDGCLVATPGVTTSFAQIEDDIRCDCSRFEVREIGYDPWQATQLAKNLADEGAAMVEVRQTVQNMSEPMKLLEALVLEGRFHHDNNPAYRWMMSNCVAHLDAKENIYPRKERVDAKIDGVVATIIALSRFQSLGDDSSFDDFVNDPLTVTW